MITEPTQVDDLMESASVSLAQRRYLDCERQCLEALCLAKNNGDWSTVTRIILPLQEARRQRRLIAAAGTIRLGTTDLPDDPQSWLDRLQTGCLVVTHPHNRQTACRLEALARDQDRYVEVLFSDNPATAESWRITTDIDQPVYCPVAAPSPHWQDRWITRPATDHCPPSSQLPVQQDKEHPRNPPHEKSESESESESDPEPCKRMMTKTPADWFLDVYELLGDAAWARFTAWPLTGLARLTALERCVEAVVGHELLHQRWAEAAAALAKADPATLP